MNLGRDLGFQEVLIEGVALSVIKKMQACDKVSSLIGAYIHDDKHKVAGFIKCDLFHIQRDENGVVDILAKEGLKLGESTYLVGQMPFFAKDAAENDLCRLCLGVTKGYSDVPL